MNVKTIVIVVVAILLGILALDSFFIVDARERAIVKRFGEVVEHEKELEGLNFKIPFVDQVEKFDGRVLILNSDPERYLTREQKPLEVDSFVKWRIFNTTQYYEATQGIEANASSRLARRVDEGLRNQIGTRDMIDVISGEREELMAELTNTLDRTMKAEFGIEVIDIRVKKIDLPREVATQVYDRMKSERNIEAETFRAEGRRERLVVQSDADKQKVTILATAEKEAEQIRGEGDGESTRIYAEAYGQDTEFYEFYRSINAYVNIFGDGSSLLVLDPSSEFFKYFKAGSGD
ncbi:MAG: protease modulator HflC [Gammaproteobacteria bacterium]|nr:protease modulator HflC [Gammaproteobacteria bacterium]MYF01530.1 protease modulator HflC [Gammaproteobacteria bacterium]MYI76405.1 protease modulator HflC [Gammaproteobacteria bacterium]